MSSSNERRSRFKCSRVDVFSLFNGSGESLTLLFRNSAIRQAFIVTKRRLHSAAICAIGIFAWLISSPVAAHADLEDQIARVNQQLADAPDDHALLAKRGALHGRHGDWQQALGDFGRAQALAPADTATRLDLDIGIALLRVGKARDALPRIDNFLAANPRSSAGWRARSQVNAALGKTDAALSDINHAIEHSTVRTPELYFERAHVLENEPGRVDELLAGIDDGIAELGPLAAFLHYAIDTEIKHHNYADALARITRLPESMAKQPRWLLRRSQVLAALDRCEEAASVNRLAMQAIEELPARRRAAPAYVALRKEIDASYASLGDLDASHCEPRDDQ